MLEILAIIMLSRLNSRNADLRGRSKTWAVVYTVLLWFSFEIVAGIVVMVIFTIVTDREMPFIVLYFPMLLAAGVGALISWLIAKRGNPIKADVVSNLTTQETAALHNSYPLSAPCEVVIIRQKSFVGMAVKTKILLNGQHMIDIGNGETRSFPTHVLQNIITANDALGTRLKTSVHFEAPSGGRVEIFLKSGKFLQELTRVYT